MSKNKVYHSDPHKDQLVCLHTYKFLTTLKKLGLEFEVPIKEILYPVSLDGVMLDKFIQAFIKTNDK